MYVSVATMRPRIQRIGLYVSVLGDEGDKEDEDEEEDEEEEEDKGEDVGSEVGGKVREGVAASSTKPVGMPF